MLEPQENTQTHHFVFFSNVELRVGHYQISNIWLPLPTWMKLNYDLWDITTEMQTTKLTQLGPDRVHWRVCIGLHEHEVSIL